MTTAVERALCDVLTNQLDELAEIVGANESAAHQTSHGADESHAGHERDARVQDLAGLLAKAAEGAVRVLVADDFKRLLDRRPVIACGEARAVALEGLCRCQGGSVECPSEVEGDAVRGELDVRVDALNAGAVSPR